MMVISNWKSLLKTNPVPRLLEEDTINEIVYLGRMM